MGRWYKCKICSYRNEGCYFNDCDKCCGDICDGCFNDKTKLCDLCEEKRRDKEKNSTSTTKKLNK